VSRAVDRFDRLMVALAGVALIVVGLGCMVWSTRSTPWWPQWIQQLPDRVSIGAAADAAALALNSLPGIETAVGSLDDVDGQLVARIDATIEATADLREVGRSCDQVSAQLAQVLGRRDVAVRVTLRFGRANSSRVA
jgi:hypothetical protein